MPERASPGKTKVGRLSDLFPLPQETLILVVASSLDVVMTHSLLTRGDGGFTESNPFARYFLDRWGMTGMAYFKGAMTLLVVVITQIVARKNELLSKRVLELATLIIVAVVIYSVSLHFKHHQISHPVESDASVRWSGKSTLEKSFQNRAESEAPNPLLSYHIAASSNRVIQHR